MEFSEEIFVGESINDLGTITYSLKRNIPVLNIYCLCINKDSHTIIEIISSHELCSERNIKKNYIIAGIAQGKREAYDLSEYIIQFCVYENWDVNDFKKNLLKYKEY